ncbi:hypothetical protein [Flindersiella endophytica]
MDDIQPAAPTAPVADKAVKLPGDPRMLRLGEAPKIPWYDGEYIHDGSKRVRVGKGHQFGRIDGGYWIQRVWDPSPNPDLAITLIDAEGRRIDVLTENPTTAPVVSPDGKRLAWIEGDGKTAVLSDARGQVLERKRMPVQVEPAGFVGDKVLLGGQSTSVLWDPSSASTKSLHIRPQMDTMATDGRDLVPVRTGKGCTGVYSFTKQKALWERCGSGATDGLSADGRYTMIDGLFQPSTSMGVVVEAKTGHLLLRIERVGLPMVWSSEPGGAVLIESRFSGGRSAIVRCVVESGRCELATEPVPENRAPSLAIN